ncbi:TMV resistance protein N-like, partial [Neltuma alba]|uniref:TMV resistance protein N-like n=1 Tax=Neltuma alba TaxID=207710 RepID=UPI0010A43A20
MGESFVTGPSSSSRPIQVYLSIKGDDETCKFTDRLWASLETDDLNTFWDDEKLEPEIAVRVHESRYTVFPIFYGVDPSEVQNQCNSFEKAFAQHEQRFPTNLRKGHIWRSAITQVANLSESWDVPYDPCPQVTDDIVREVKKKVRQLEYVDADLVGMPSRVRDVEKLLELGMNDEVPVLGICGMGGEFWIAFIPVKYDVQVVTEKSLMAIVDQKIQMHSLVQEMGREIVRHKFPSKPEEWSKLWDFDDIFGVMQNDMATLEVKAIVLELEDSQGPTLRAESLSRMRNLRLLIFRIVKFSGVLKYLPLWLQYISWHQYPFTSLPSSFRPFFLAELILPNSRVTSIWDDEEEKGSLVIKSEKSSNNQTHQLIVSDLDPSPNLVKDNGMLCTFYVDYKNSPVHVASSQAFMGTTIHCNKILSDQASVTVERIVFQNIVPYPMDDINLMRVNNI